MDAAEPTQAPPQTPQVSDKPQRKVRKLVAPSFTEEELRTILLNWIHVVSELKYLRAENFFIYLMLQDTGNKAAFVNKSYMFNEWMSLTTMLADIAVDQFSKDPQDIEIITSVLYDLTDLTHCTYKREARPKLEDRDHVQLRSFFVRYQELHKNLADCCKNLTTNKRLRMTSRLNDLTKRIQAFQAAYEGTTTQASSQQGV